MSALDAPRTGSSIFWGPEKPTAELESVPTVRVLRSEHPHAHQPVVRQRTKGINRGEPRTFPHPAAVILVIDAADVDQLVEPQLVTIAHFGQRRGQVLGCDDGRDFPKRRDDALDLVAERGG